MMSAIVSFDTLPEEHGIRVTIAVGSRVREVVTRAT